MQLSLELLELLNGRFGELSMASGKAPEHSTTTSSRSPASTTAEYLDDLLNSMMPLAQRSGHRMLAYLIEMAALEAARLARKS